MATAHKVTWPDKAMFAAILLILAGALGAVFRLARPLVSLRQEGLPVLFTDDIPGYEIALCLVTLALGVLCLRRQAAVFGYLGALCGILSLGMYGLVPFLSLLAVVAMLLSYRDGEETRNDGVQLHPRHWPDKAMAASLVMVVVGAVAVLQGLLIFAGMFDPILLTDVPAVAASAGVLFGLFALVAAREVYNLRNEWMGWVALSLGLATLGFYLVGPVLALLGMVLLRLAHREDEFSLHGPAPAAAAAAKVEAKPARPPRKGRRGTAG